MSTLHGIRPTGAPRAARQTVLLGNSQALLREGLSRLLGERGELQVVGELSVLEHVQQRVDELRPDIIVLDDAGGGGATAQMVSELRAHHPGLGIVVLSGREAIRPALELVRAGASALLSREDSFDDLERALAAVGRGESFVSARLAWAASGDPTHFGAAAGPEALSGRETELLQHVADGATLREASRRMAISESTASTYRSRMLKKLKLSNTAQLIRFAVDNEIYGPPRARSAEVKPTSAA